MTVAPNEEEGKESCSSFSSSPDVLLRRIRHVREQRNAQNAAHSRNENSAHAAALNSVVELGAGVAVGGGSGWILDDALGSKPWLLLLGILLGTVSGFLMIYRAGMRASAGDEEQEKP